MNQTRTQPVTFVPGAHNAVGPTLITGGAGFIGANLADRLLSHHIPVRIFDNLSRPGVEQNLDWLVRKHSPLVQIRLGDIRDANAVKSALKGVTHIFHFAAQVATTTSLVQPLQDFDINARGTLNLLEALRQADTPAGLVFTSTSKVYGQLQDVPLEIGDGRYQPVAEETRQGFNEQRPLDFHSPYGCSKGAADQYVLDYARTFGLSAAVFRMSCIYGPHQCGTEDQGWVAHFLIRALAGDPVTLYGDGRQVRDLLYVDDLLDALILAQSRMDAIRGHAFNIGGGPARTLSPLELVELIGRLHGAQPQLKFEDWRAADQRYYVSDIRRFSEATGWTPKVNVRDGVSRLYAWLQAGQRAASVAPFDSFLPLLNAPFQNP